MENEYTQEVLLIDQDKEFCSELKAEISSLKKFECVATAHDGKTGLELIMNAEPDYIVMDLILSHLDGLSILNRLKERQMMKEINIIIISSFLNEQILKILQTYEIDYFMSKPADLECIKNRIKDLNREYKFKNYDLKIKESEDLIDKEGNIHIEISRLLDEFGIPVNIRGYLYLRNAIYLSITNLGLVNSITKKLYPEIANNFSTQSSRVERAIRHAIKVAWERGNKNKITDYFGYCISETIGRPTNAQFIAKVADDFRLKNNMISN